jgi:acyl dehydratase
VSAISGRYLEDYAVGQIYGSGVVRVDADRMTSFSTEFDPQPFHLSAAGAADAIFGSLAASGWYTAACAGFKLRKILPDRVVSHWTTRCAAPIHSHIWGRAYRHF